MSQRLEETESMVNHQNAVYPGVSKIIWKHNK